MSESLEAFCTEGLAADWRVYQYTDNVYKIVKFPNGVPHGRRRSLPDTDKAAGDPERRLSASLSRSRRIVLELALCNTWDYFATFTISSATDRFNLKGWYKRFTQWLRDVRKKGYSVDYILIPERHKDGSWHCHGLMSGLPPLVSFKDMRKKYHRKVPNKLYNSDYLCWLEYDQRFGFCSFGPVHDPEAAAFYITKYMTKDNSRLVSEFSKHLYRATQGLNHAAPPVSFYGTAPELEPFLKVDGEFCKSGFVRSFDNIDWVFKAEYGSPSKLLPLFENDNYGYVSAEKYLDFEQLCF